MHNAHIIHIICTKGSCKKSSSLNGQAIKREGGKAEPLRKNNFFLTFLFILLQFENKKVPTAIKLGDGG